MCCICCHIRVTVTNHSSCHDTEQMKISYQTREEEEEDITPALRVSHSACSSSFSSCLLFLLLFSCCCCCFVFVAVAVLNLRKMAQRNKLKCSKSRRRRCRASFHSATSYHTTTQHKGVRERGGGDCGSMSWHDCNDNKITLLSSAQQQTRNKNFKKYHT